MAGSAMDSAATAVENATRDAQTAMTDAADAYREAIDDVRSQLPTFDEIVGQAARLPGVPISRAGYLAEAFGSKYQAKTALAIETTPARAGMSNRQIAKLAKSTLGREARRTTIVSIASGIPGGMAAAATIPADLIQLYGHLIRAIQELTYLYGWRDLVHLDGSEPDPATRAALVLFLGSMARVERANGILGWLASMRSSGYSDGMLRDILLGEECQAAVEETALTLGDNITRRLTGRIVDKAIPLVGAVISGVVTKGDFGSMCGELHKQLQAWGA